MRAYEIRHGIQFFQEALPPQIHSFIDWEDFHPLPSHAKGNAINAAAGFPNLRKGCATQAAGGYPVLKKGNATQAAAGHPSMKKGNATQAAAGFPGLKKVMLPRLLPDTRI
ncbi:hypothetical protein MMC16_005934 [Acarospora aff. strigata]|nr:hypothetical protein [Acarospora aff. strigata]